MSTQVLNRNTADARQRLSPADQFESTTLGALATLGNGTIQTGPFGSQLHASDYLASGVPVVMPVNIGDNRIVESGIARVSEEDASRLSRHRVRTGDIIYSRRGDVERRAIVREENGWLCGTGCLLVRLDSDRVNPSYISYWLGTPSIRAWIVRHAVGATMPNLNTSILSAVPVMLPPIEVQDRIAMFLGLLDDKIDSNSKAIGLATQLMAAEFRFWRASATGGNTTTFGNFCDVFGGSTPRTGEAGYWDGPNAWATPTDITALKSPYLFATRRNITDAGLMSCTTMLHPVDSIFMTSRATIGAFAINQMPAATNQGFIVVHPRRSYHRWFLLEEMRARVGEMLDRSNGSTFMELSRGSFKLMNINVPSDVALQRLDLILAPLHARCAQLTREVAILIQNRDFLLDGLTAGRITIESVTPTTISAAR